MKLIQENRNEIEVKVEKKSAARGFNAVWDKANEDSVDENRKNAGKCAQVMTLAPLGVAAIAIEVQCHQFLGLPNMQIIGLPGPSVREARERVRSALISCGIKIPNKRLVINLSPACLKKEGTAFDLAIAVAILVSSGEIAAEKLNNIILLGELTLDGQIKSVSYTHVLPGLLRKGNFIGAIVPFEGSEVLANIKLKFGGAFHHLKDVIRFLKSDQLLVETKRPNDQNVVEQTFPDFGEIEGQKIGKRGMMISAVGAHNIYLSGARGCGKSSLCSAYGALLPPLNAKEKEELAAIYSVSNVHWNLFRPIRAPHFSITRAALIGGGVNCVPGELSLAHLGVLFLDEVLEFKKGDLENLRLPMDSANIHLARAGTSVTIPADFILLAASNLCPCGLYGSDNNGACQCADMSIRNYQARISRAMLDRIDIHILLACPKPGNPMDELNTQKMFKKTQDARRRQLDRQKCLNGKLKHQDLFTVKSWSESALDYYKKSRHSGEFSYRALNSLAGLALSISDLAGSLKVEQEHLKEATYFRRLKLYK